MIVRTCAGMHTMARTCYFVDSRLRVIGLVLFEFALRGDPSPTSVSERHPPEPGRKTGSSASGLSTFWIQKSKQPTPATPCKE